MLWNPDNLTDIEINNAVDEELLRQAENENYD